jgi:hypothetical protein
VDGGYFENSGVATALDIISRLRQMKHDVPIKFVLIALSSVSIDIDTDQPSYAAGEIMSPFRALDSTRAARGRLAIAQAQLSMDGAACPQVGSVGHEPCVYKGTVRISMLATGDLRLPLGWHLSNKSREAIEHSISVRELCEVGVIMIPFAETSLRAQVAANARHHNGCLMAQIDRDLKSGVH